MQLQANEYTYISDAIQTTAGGVAFRFDAVVGPLPAFGSGPTFAGTSEFIGHPTAVKFARLGAYTLAIDVARHAARVETKMVG